MLATAIVWIGLCLAFTLAVGIAVGRHFEHQDRTLRNRMLDEADREIAGLHALERINRSTPARW